MLPSVRLSPVLLLALSSCGLLGGQPSLPLAEDIFAAREGEEAEWQLLAESLQLVQHLAPEDAVLELEAQVRRAPDSIRLRALMQDFERRTFSTAERSAWAEGYRLRFQELGDAPSAWLAARASSGKQARALVVQALALDPEYVPAQVFALGLAAKPGDDTPLNQLVRLLAEHPGSAEGWRLLAWLAPLYDRPDLALAAAQTEPWLDFGDVSWAKRQHAFSALAAERPSEALAALQGLDDRADQMLRARCLIDLGRIRGAARILGQLVEDDPQDAIAHFNYGLLARDHLQQRALARREFAAALECGTRFDSLPMVRQIQARLWLEQMAKKGGPKRSLDESP